MFYTMKILSFAPNRQEEYNDHRQNPHFIILVHTVTAAQKGAVWILATRTERKTSRESERETHEEVENGRKKKMFCEAQI